MQPPRQNVSKEGGEVNIYQGVTRSATRRKRNSLPHLSLKKSTCCGDDIVWSRTFFQCKRSSRKGTK
ncbi:unnamed protein product [Eruca vesicaria subsp. sativa]|uniref:Uncharacterized protein n=1 Tax=Eruca vesicaria subsp. sativa TaxID=29727 RepID=A0ABC8IUJ0_ERUVS|nr:unnamed protein product [Eruca vesicaria subsp. sativa]